MKNSEKMKTEIIGELTPQEIAALKKEHGALAKVTVSHADGVKSVGFFKMPSRDVYALAMMQFGKNDVLGGNEVVLDNCFVSGDAAIKTNDSLRMAAAMQMGTLLELLPSAIEKL